MVMPIMTVIERTSYLHARYIWPDARACIGNLQGPFQVFPKVNVIGGTHASFSKASTDIEERLRVGIGIVLYRSFSWGDIIQQT
jgi:hypothetical protein